MAARKQHTTDDSKGAETGLNLAVKKVREELESQGHKTLLLKELAYWDIKNNYSKISGCPQPTDEDKRFSIRPDGGVLFVDGKLAGIFEHKFGGTGDKPGNEKEKWTGGSAIDRTGKNLNALKMYCKGTGLFPYVVFCHGCGFHPKLTMYHRLEQMNHGFPSKMMIVTPTDSAADQFEKILDGITPESVRPTSLGLEVATVLIKTHAARGPDAMEHGASDWTVDEYAQIILKVIKASGAV